MVNKKKTINQVVHVNFFAGDSRSSLRWEHWSQLAGRKNREASLETETFLVFGRANSQCLAACVVKSQEISGPKAHWIPKDRAHECLNVFLVLPNEPRLCGLFASSARSLDVTA